MNTPDSFTINHFPVGCLVTSASRQIIFSNYYLEQQCGYPPSDLFNADLFTLLSRASQIMYDSYLVPLLLREGQCNYIRLSLVARSGKTLPAIVSIRRDEANGGRLFWTISDAARSEEMFRELKEAKELLDQKNSLLYRLAHTDQLTGLPNRSALAGHLSQKITSSKTGELAFALAFVDLDGFKEVNDRYGHAMGDALLCLGAKRMASNLRSNDLVARFGGDEFVIVLHGDFTASIAEESLRRLIRQLSEPFDVDSVTLQISASVGIALYPQTEEVDPDQLIRQADQAMYEAKISGRNQFRIFNVNK